MASGQRRHSTTRRQRVSTTDGDASLPDAPWPSAPPGTPGLKVGFPGAHELAGPTPRVSHRAKVLLLLAGLGVLTVLLVVVALVATPGPAPYCNPLKCQGPPIRHPGLQQSAAGSPVAAGILYTNSQGFSVRYLSGAEVQTAPRHRPDVRLQQRGGILPRGRWRVGGRGHAGDCSGGCGEPRVSRPPADL